MKAFYYLLCAFFLLGCDQYKQSEKIKDRIPGTYVFTGKTAFSKGDDTIKIKLYDDNAGTYIVVRSTGYQQLVDGKYQPKKFKMESFIGSYDPKKQQLVEAKTGRILSFATASKDLLFGTATYRKIQYL